MTQGLLGCLLEDATYHDASRRSYNTYDAGGRAASGQCSGLVTGYANLALELISDQRNPADPATFRASTVAQLLVHCCSKHRRQTIEHGVNRGSSILRASVLKSRPR